MTKAHLLKHEFVEFMPETLVPGILYVSIPYATVAHSCCCGCGLQVITPLSPTDWKLTFDGETISLDPSIGNWNFPCRSHYWIKRNSVVWAGAWDQRRVEQGRQADIAAKREQFQPRTPAPETPAPVPVPKPLLPRSKWYRFLDWFR